MQVPIRELKANLSRYLAQARAGEAVEVTSHRKTVARIVGVPATELDGVASLAAQGAISWNGRKPKFRAPVKLSPRGQPVGDMVLEDRG